MHWGSSGYQTGIKPEAVQSAGIKGSRQFSFGRDCGGEAAGETRPLLCFGFAERRDELLARPGDLILGDDGRGSQKKVVAADAVDAALHGVDEQASLRGSGGNASGEVLIRREGTLAGFVGNEFYGPKQTDAPDVAYRALVAQALEGLFEVRGGSPGLTRVGGFHQLCRLKMAQHSASGGERNGMRVVGEAVQERSCSSGNRVDKFPAGD